MSRKISVFTHLQSKSDLLIGSDRTAQAREWGELVARYQNCGSITRVYAFIAEGYTGVTSGKSQWVLLDKERRMRKLLREVIEKAGPSAGGSKIQIVGVRELIPTLGSLERAAAGRELKDLLLGQSQHIFYDSPKMAEAIIRIVRGRISPSEILLRFDEDVGINEHGVRELAYYHWDESRRAERERMARRGVFYFFSGNYRAEKLRGGKPDYLNDYAVRVTAVADRTRGDESSGYPVNEDLARKFIESIAEIGADQDDQSISGAGLCMSLEAITILPPFANAGHQIVWIDDHLKRLLHEALGHLPSPANGGHRSSRKFRVCRQANFLQDRHPGGRIPHGYVENSGGYLERLVRGCLMDALIWDREPSSPGCFAEQVKRVRYDKVLPQPDFPARASAAARKRFAKIEELWSHRDYEGCPVKSFAETMGSARESLVGGTIRDCQRYLTLLEDWSVFVDLIEHLDVSDPAQAWIAGDQG